MINDEIIAEHLKSELSFVWVYCFSDRVEGLQNTLFHLRHNILVYINAAIRLLVHQHLLKSFVAELITVFEFAVGVELFLDGIIRQMYCRIIDISNINTELVRRCSNIALFEEVQVLIMVKEDPATDVEFAVED